MSKTYMGNLYLTKACTCKEKDKANWIIIGITNSSNPSYLVQCQQCRNQWRTKGECVKELRRVSWLNK